MKARSNTIIEATVIQLTKAALRPFRQDTCGGRGVSAAGAAESVLPMRGGRDISPGAAALGGACGGYSEAAAGVLPKWAERAFGKLNDGRLKSWAPR